MISEFCMLRNISPVTTPDRKKHRRRRRRWRIKRLDRRQFPEWKSRTTDSDEWREVLQDNKDYILPQYSLKNSQSCSIRTEAEKHKYLCILSTGWRNWWDPTVQHLCHVCKIRSSHQQQTARRWGQAQVVYFFLLLSKRKGKKGGNFKGFPVHTCIALLPSFTTSNSIMFSMPFSWWWPFIRPAPFPPFPFSPAAFFPFFPPWESSEKTNINLRTTAERKERKTMCVTNTCAMVHLLHLYLSFSWICTPSIRILREVCVWGESSVCIPDKNK